MGSTMGAVALTAGAVRTPDTVGQEVMLVAVADRLHNLRTLRPCPPASRRRVADGVRRVDPVRASEAVAAFGGGAAVLGGGIDPELALATGGTGLVALAAAVLLGRNPEATRRLAQLLEAWRRR